MRRLRDWQSRMQDCLAERCVLPFEWGSNDCCLFAADAVLACTGVDLAADLRGTYSNAAEAAKLVRDLGGLAALVAARLGPEVAPTLAQPGDVGLLISEGRECLGVCTGSCWAAPSAERLIQLPMSQALHAWRV